MCCLMEGALRIHRDASHPLCSAGGRGAVEGQSSNMQSGLLKGKFSFNCGGGGALLLLVFSQLPDGGGGWKKKVTWCNSCASFHSSHNSRRFGPRSDYCCFFYQQSLWTKTLSAVSLQSFFLLLMGESVASWTGNRQKTNIGLKMTVPIPSYVDPTDLPPTYVPIASFLLPYPPTYPPSYIPTHLNTSLPNYLLPTSLPTYVPSFLPTHLPTYLPCHLLLNTVWILWCG